MKTAIIGYGTMGKLLAEGFLSSGRVCGADLSVASRTFGETAGLAGKCSVCRSNAQAARDADVLFLCVRPQDIRSVLEEIRGVFPESGLLVSLNGSVRFSQMESVLRRKTEKLIPSVTAEIGQSQSLVCYNSLVQDGERKLLVRLAESLGTVTELDEDELGMGAELASCMPGFVAAILQELALSAQKRTDIPPEQVAGMLLSSMTAAGKLMLEKGYSFGQLMSKVATRGGITEEGADVIRRRMPAVADELFERTLEKRRLTAETAQKAFGEQARMEKSGLELFLEESYYVDFSAEIIRRTAESLFRGKAADTDKARAAYEFVRDEIPHTFDLYHSIAEKDGGQGAAPVQIAARASEVLRHKHGICHAKANLLAALLRATGIPCGFCFQHITLLDDDSVGYCLHAFNAALLDGRWIRLDARGNRRGIRAEFSLAGPVLAFPPRPQFDEYFFPGIHHRPDGPTMEMLERADGIRHIMRNIPEKPAGPATLFPGGQGRGEK